MGTRAWSLAVLVILWGVLGVKIAVAADWSLVPAVEARSEFNSNLFYDFKNPKSDFIFTLRSSTEYNYATEVSQLQGKLGVTGLKYASHSDRDHIDQNYQINGSYRVAPRWNLSLSSSYIVDTTLQEELIASGLIMSRSPRQSFQVGPGVSYNLTERLTGTVSYSYNRVLYSDPHFSNSTSQQVGLNLGYPLNNQKTLLNGNILGRESQLSGDNLYRSLGINAGAKHNFSETWEVNFLAGLNISFVNSNTQIQDFSQFPFFVAVKQARFKKTSVSPSFSLSTTRRWTNFSVSGGYRRDQAASAYGTIAEVNALFLSMNYNFSERMSGTLGANYSLSNQISQSNSFDNDYYSLSPQLSYKITEKFTTSVGYNFSIRDDITGGRSANVHVAWFMFNYTYPIHYQK